MNDNKVSTGGGAGIGFTEVLQIVFIVLKLCKVINWNWIWVLAPTWIVLIIVVIICCIMFWLMR